MNALNHTAERIIAAKTQPKPRQFTVQVEAAKADGPLVNLAVYVTAETAEAAEATARANLLKAGYALRRIVRALSTIAA